MSTMTIHSPSLAQYSLVGWLEYSAQLLNIWQQRSHQRYQLRQLEEHQLMDIGISKTEALEEACKAFWQE